MSLRKLNQEENSFICFNGYGLSGKGYRIVGIKICIVFGFYRNREILNLFFYLLVMVLKYIFLI